MDIDNYLNQIFSLKGKVSLVTGASRGLGRGYALTLAHAGSDLIVISRNKKELQSLRNELSRTGTRMHVLPGDLSNLKEIPGLVQRSVEEYGKIDILINNAGMNIRKPILELTEEDLKKVIDLNLMSVFLMSKYVGRRMIQQGGGKIINVASLTSFIGLPNISIYGSSKGGVVSLTKAFATEWAKYRINVNAIAPGYFETELTSALFKDKEKLNWLLSRIPLGRTGVPEDLSGVLLFLVSSASDYVTGQVIAVDGGWLSS
jgi:2-deoxy-D-gluconate 3-dehydrogenase